MVELNVDKDDFRIDDDLDLEDKTKNGSSAFGFGMAQPSHCCMHLNDDDIEFKKNLAELEDKWFLETQQQFADKPWYKRPNKTTLLIILAFYTLSFTILMSPLMILMLENICQGFTGNASSSDASPSSSSMMGNGGGSSSGMMGNGGGSSNMMNGSNGMSGAKNTLKFLMKRMDMGSGGGMGGSTCKDIGAQKTLSNIQSFLSFLSGMLGFMLSGKYGQLSDRFGRVYIFKFFCSISTIHSILLIIYFDWIGTYNKFWMILFLSFGYISGGIMTLISNANGYISDIVDTESRPVYISILMSVTYLSLGFGPLIGSFIKKLTGSDMTILYFSLILAIIPNIMVFTCLVETKHPESLRLANERYEERYATEKFGLVGTFKSFFKPIKRLWLPRTETGSILPRINVLTLCLIDIISMAACVGTMHVLIIYCIVQFNWTSIEINYYMSITGFGKAFVLLFLSPLLIKILTKKFNYRPDSESIDKIDKVLVISSLFFVFLSIFFALFASSSMGIYISAILESLGGMLSPIIQSSIVKFSSRTESGEMFGAIALVRHLAMFLFPLLFLQIYSFSVSFFPRLFLVLIIVATGIMLAAAPLGLRISNEQKNRSLEEEFDSSM